MVPDAPKFDLKKRQKWDLVMKNEIETSAE